MGSKFRSGCFGATLAYETRISDTTTASRREVEKAPTACD